MTPFTPDTPPTVTGESVDSGFQSIDEVIAMMGEPERRPTETVLIYGGVCFTQTPLYLERPNQ
jgi:hypothetical protein